MLYQSTRGCEKKISAAAAIAMGLAEDGGLFVPEDFPSLTRNAITELAAKPYKDRAAYVMGLYLTDFDAAELEQYTAEAYSAQETDSTNSQLHPQSGSWGSPAIAPLYKLDGNTHFLELWHGPTCAFKDMALQVMPRLLTASLRKINENREVCVLVATSGDTGKAALEGFCDVPGTKIMVFYPRDGVSQVQELQMTSQGGGNVNVVAVLGNFDDAQTGVKAIFSDEKLRQELHDAGVFLSSANSINWGRLVPQIAYYVSAYCDLLTSGEIKCGDKINFCVPTGNFGNILAGYYAEKMGLPINKLICASNRNDVLTQFLGTGVYDKNRPFYTTASPSMDILVSSNLERLLHELSGKDGGAVSGFMSELAEKGMYKVPEAIHDEAERVFAAGCCFEDDTMKTIAGTFQEHNYLIDTHTAVAYKVLRDYRAVTGDCTPTVVVSTASPYKFCDNVLRALEHPPQADGVELLDTLSEATGTRIPAPLAKLKSSRPRFTKTVQTEAMKSAVQDFLRSKTALGG